MWLPRILFQLHSECQAPLNRAASRSSWRQEPTPAGTEAGSHCGLAGPLYAQACPLLSTEQHRYHRVLAERSVWSSGSQTPSRWWCTPTLGTCPPWPSATFQDFALGMFSFWCGRKQRPLLYMARARNIKFAVGNVWNFHLFCVFICLPEPILSCSSGLFQNKPSFSSRLKSSTIKTSFFIHFFILSLLLPSLLSLSAALPIPLPLICVLSLPQSQIIPSLWNWKIAAGESKREIILSD